MMTRPWWDNSREREGQGRGLAEGLRFRKQKCAVGWRAERGDRVLCLVLRAHGPGLLLGDGVLGLRHQHAHKRVDLHGKRVDLHGIEVYGVKAERDHG